MGDPLRLRQILWHLVGNGVKFTREGQVEVRASATAGLDRQAKLDAKRSTTPGSESLRISLPTFSIAFGNWRLGYREIMADLGLGLAVAQKLIALLDGSISVESDLGKGSIFTVILPFKLPVESGAGKAEVTKFRGRVLVVDDNSVASKSSPAMLYGGNPSK